MSIVIKSLSNYLNLISLKIEQNTLNTNLIIHFVASEQIDNGILCVSGIIVSCLITIFRHREIRRASVSIIETIQCGSTNDTSVETKKYSMCLKTSE